MNPSNFVHRDWNRWRFMFREERAQIKRLRKDYATMKSIDAVIVQNENNKNRFGGNIICSQIELTILLKTIYYFKRNKAFRTCVHHQVHKNYVH